MAQGWRRDGAGMAQGWRRDGAGMAQGWRRDGAGMAQGWRRDGAVVRALASHQCGPGSIPRSGVTCELSLLVLYSAPRGFLRVLRFPLSSKPKFELICVNC